MQSKASNNRSKSSTGQQRPSWLISFISLAFVLVVTLLVVDWHNNSSGGGGIFSYNSKTLSHDHHHRRLQIIKEQDVLNTIVVDDDETRDDRCREYLEHFLNGTTDDKDECDGMKNAYEAADCEDSNSVFPFIRKHHHHHHNGATDDEVLIDDYIEAWRCCSSIYMYYTEHCQRQELASFMLLGIVSVLVLCGLAMSLLKTFQVQWIPDAAACILVGATVGGVVRVVYPSCKKYVYIMSFGWVFNFCSHFMISLTTTLLLLFTATVIQENISFDNDLFLHILLPPIIFQAALSIDKKAFRRDLFPILTFAIGGTVLSTLIIGFMTYGLSSLSSGASLPLLDSLIFGSLISSIDPVATLGILSGVGVSKTDTLYTLVFGESLLNDGVAIVLFDTMVRHLGDNAVVDRALVREISTGFLKVTVASIGIGVACGIVCTIYFWALRRKHTAVVETAIFFSFALIPFYIADGFGHSGMCSKTLLSPRGDYS